MSETRLPEQARIIIIIVIITVIIMSNILSTCNNTNVHYVLDSVNGFSQPPFHFPSSW